MAQASPEMETYFSSIEQEVQSCVDLATKARQKGLDPEKTVPIPLAKNMAERVVGLISVVCPQIVGTKVTQRIVELEKEFGQLDWRVGLTIAEEVAKQKFFQLESKQEAMEIGIRVGFAYLTLGVVSAPLEGFIGIKIKKTKDGKEYFAPQYAGPIRGAGGTAASISVVLTDYVRLRMGYAKYDPDEKEVSRYVTDAHDYHDRVTNLQYRPSEEELRFMVSHLPVEVDGDPTERFEVSNYKDLPRIDTNMIRGGVALVLAEGLCQKSPKLWKKLKNWGKDFDLEWDFLEGFIELKEKIHASHGPKKAKDTTTKKTVKPNNTFIMDLVAGRPILTHPLGVGGFRLRYGRGRTCGMYAVGMHPSTLLVLRKYIAIGTQLKVERPRKGASVTICDTLEAPIVRLIDGSVLQLSNPEESKSVISKVEEILFLGDILFNFGDFSESGHTLVPVGYCPEWWILEVKKALGNKPLPNNLKLTPQRQKDLLDRPLEVFPTFKEAKDLGTMLKVPLHPNFTFYWKLITAQQTSGLVSWLQQGKIKRVAPNPDITKIILPYHNDEFRSYKNILDELGLPHKVVNKENIVIEKTPAQALAFSLGFKIPQQLASLRLPLHSSLTSGLDYVNLLCPIEIKDKAGTFIGARMGRPEKAKMRHLTGSPQAMFPVGEEGGRLRSFQAALDAGKVRSNFPLHHCSSCEKDMIYAQCEECAKDCEPRFHCRFCGDLDKDRCRHGVADKFKTFDLDIQYYFTQAKKRLGEKLHPDLIKGIRGTSNKDRVVEHLAKGILRAKHSIYVNKDGTTRYDMTQLPLTHFKPKEIGTPIEKLKELGYTKDIHGKPLVDTNQILEIKPQDVVLPGYDSLEESAPKVLSRVAQFVDDLLVNFYKLQPHYHIKDKFDLVGQLVIGLAPHISGGMVGRIIGFSETQGFLAHPMFHAAMRRDCDGDECAVMLLMDAFLNFSRRYLPNSRGSTMDAPLVLTSRLNPAEIDDQVLDIDTVWSYPLELYEAAEDLKYPGEVRDHNGNKVEQLSDRLGTELQYEKFGFTHGVDNFNKGVLCSAYKTVPSMTEKLLGQMEIAKQVRAVDMDDVAKLVIQKHFLKDIKGNLRKFSMQQFRCVKCNTKYRRPPLLGKCDTCKGKLIFTISEGSVVKYLGPSLMLGEKYDFSPYLKQTLEILKMQVDTIFGKKDKQVGLSTFMGT